MLITYIRACMQACMPTYVRNYAGTYMHECIQTYKHTYIHTYIHTYCEWGLSERSTVHTPYASGLCLAQGHLCIAVGTPQTNCSLHRLTKEKSALRARCSFVLLSLSTYRHTQDRLIYTQVAGKIAIRRLSAVSGLWPYGS